MRLKCISTSTNTSCSDNTALHFRWLTIDKIYDVQHPPQKTTRDLGAATDYYYVIDDGGEMGNYPKHCFIDLQKFREEKLKQLGI